MSTLAPHAPTRRPGVLRFFAKTALLLAPFAAWQIIEILVLPPATFTFRVWEAVLAMPYRYPGPFYPDQHIIKEHEFGDRYRILPPEKREAKRVEWFTDAYGWRNRPEFASLPVDVVITGDSNIVGSFQDQKDTLSETLSRRGNLRAYSYAIGHDHVSLFFNDPRFREHPPKLLVVESKAGNWLANNSLLFNFVQSTNGALTVRDRAPEFAIYYNPDRNQVWELFRSRLAKQSFYNFLQSDLHLTFIPPNRDFHLNGHPPPATPDSHPALWLKSTTVNGRYVARPEGKGITIEFSHRGGSTAYWQSEYFQRQPGQRLRLRYEAKVNGVVSEETVWLFKGDMYDAVFKPIVTRDWQEYDVPLDAPADMPLRVQIDNGTPERRMHLRHIRIEGARAGEPAVAVPDATVQSAPFQPASITTDSGPAGPPPEPPNLTPLDLSGATLTDAEANYYFYHAVKLMHDEAARRGMDFIFYLMPDSVSSKLAEATRRLRAAGIKVLAYEPTAKYNYGVDMEWYWQAADSHWSEGAVRLTADEILRMWRDHHVDNRPFAPEMEAAYSTGFPTTYPSP